MAQLVSGEKKLFPEKCKANRVIALKGKPPPKTTLNNPFRYAVLHCFAKSSHKCDKSLQCIHCLCKLLYRVHRVRPQNEKGCP